MPDAAPPDLAFVLTFLRSGLGWTNQADFARRVGIPPNHLNDLEKGRRPLDRKRLEQILAAVGVTPEVIDVTLGCLAACRALAAAHGPAGGSTTEAQRRIEAVSLQMGRMATDFARSTLSLLTLEGQALQARQEAELLWERLRRHSPELRRKMVALGRKFQTWALCELVCRESVKAAPNHPAEALELADLAVAIAERVPGEAAWSQRVQGYAWAHLANARHVCNLLPSAAEGMARARKLWDAGAPGDPGLLNPAWVPGLEASLLRSRRRFPEALQRIEEALALDRGELRAQILMTKARIYETLGDPEASTAALQEAAPLIHPEREPQLALYLSFSLLVNLAHLGRFSEAEDKLLDVQRLVERSGGELDLARVVWLKARCAAGLGRLSQAQSAFEQVRQVFKGHELTFDYALVSLELSLLLLEQGNRREVAKLSGEMLNIFKVQGVQPEVFAALKLFCDAARQGTASIELARRIIKFLYRVQYDPELRFEDGAGEL